MRSILTMAALVAATLPLATAAAQTLPAYTARAAPLYSGPQPDYPGVRTIPRGVGVSMHGCLRDRSWCDVTYRASRGWIAGDVLRIRHDGRRRRLSGDIGIGVLSFSFGSYWDSNYRGRRFYGERERWQTHYQQAYRPEWGERDQGARDNRPSGDNRSREDRRMDGQNGEDRRDHNWQVPRQDEPDWRDNTPHRTAPDAAPDQSLMKNRHTMRGNAQHWRSPAATNPAEGTPKADREHVQRPHQ